MYRVIDGRGTGKTSKLLFEALDNDGVVICAHPEAMAYKAHAYGIVGLQFYSYFEYLSGAVPSNKKVYIDELDMFLKHQDVSIAGYTLSNDED